MTQEDKKLLLVDLCARLPYGVKCYDFHYDNDGNKIDDVCILETLNPIYKQHKYVGVDIEHDISRIKPYLRPLSSMTEEEQNELDKVSDGSLILHNNEIRCLSMSKWEDSFNFILKGIDWLDRKMFDHRTNEEGKTLIEAGLTLEAPEGMY